MFKIDTRTTWWSPTPEIVVDARDIIKVEIEVLPKLEGGQAYRVHVSLAHSYSLDLLYSDITKLNDVLSIIGLTWEEADA